MEFLCDVHISIKIAKFIEDLGFKCEHVNRILNKWNTTDDEIISYIDKKDLILITKDQDFRNSFLLNSKPKKLIKVDLGNIKRKAIGDYK
jgi:predicted nuclease of predicted toxin-antitoxin system